MADFHTAREFAQFIKGLGFRAFVAGTPGGDGSICCACVPGSYSREWVDKYIPGKEGADWFFIEERRD